MRKPLTGEPCAGKPHARFGGRGGLGLLYPYQGKDFAFGRSVVEDPDMGLLKPANVESGSAPKPANVGLFECRPTGAMFS